MNILHEHEQLKWTKDNPSYPFHFVNCKIATQKNNTFQLIDRVLAITKEYIYIYYYKQQDSNVQYQALQKSKSQPIPLQVLECPQAKIQIKKAYSWSYFTQSDPSMIKYIQQILPAYATNVSPDLSLVLIKNNADFEIFNLFLQNQQLAKQLCYALDRTQIMKRCDKFIKLKDGQWNQRIINMLCQAKKGLVIFDPQDFGFGWRKSYDLNDEQKQLRFVIDSVDEIAKKLPQQMQLKMQLRFKITDDQSGQYAFQFVSIDQCKRRLTQLCLKNCSLTQEQFESFMIKTQPLTKKINLKFPQLYHLDLSLNKLTDNIFDSLDRLFEKDMFPQLYRLNLSKNYLSLSSNSTYILTNFLSKVNYQLELNLSENRIADCHFVKKYLINADRKSTLPLQYLNLEKNKIKQQQKYKLLQLYLKRKAQDARFSLILNLGEVTNFRQSQVKYFQILNKYFRQNEYLNKQSSDFFINQNIEFTPMVFTRQASGLAQSNSRVSLISNPSGINLNLSNDKLINQLFQSLTKLYVLQDYKQISLYRKQMQKNGITQKILTSSLSKQIEQKKRQEKRVALEMQRIINFQTSQKQINKKLQSFIGLIRRRGIEGKAAEYLVYLKYKRDLLMQEYLASKQSFEHNNPSYQILQKKMTSYSRIFKMQNEKVDSFLQVDYQILLQSTEDSLYDRLMQIKSLGIDLNKFDQKGYNRLKYLLLSDQYVKNINTIQPILQAILLQLKLPLVRFLRYCNCLEQKKVVDLIKIKAKQKLTKSLPIETKNKVQILSKFDILNYEFNYSVDKDKISGNPSILSRISYDEKKYAQIIGFIQIVNNFVVFLYYTPQQISQQTITYLVYIIQFLYNLPKQTKQDRQLQNILIQEMYLHILAYESNTKLGRGILAAIFQYLTSRLYCSESLQKYILAFLIKNQSLDIESIKINIRNANINQNTFSLSKKIVRPDWLLPSPMLGLCLLNHLMIDITIHNGSNQSITMQFPQNITVNQIWLQLQNKKFKNGNFQQTIFDKLGILKQESYQFWIYQQKNINKIKYFQPLQSQLYFGQLVCVNKLERIRLKRALYSDRFHNRKVLKYEMKQIQLISLYKQIRQNLLQSLALTSQSYYDLQPYQYESQITKDYFLNILAQTLFIQFSIQEKVKLAQLFSSQYRSNFSQQEFQDLYNQQKGNILKTFIHKINEDIVVNFKTLSMDQKFKVSQLIKQKGNPRTAQSIGQKIGNFIQKIGDWGYTQTLINKQQIFVVNNRLLWIGSISHHTNQLGEIINSFTQLKQCIQLKLVINVLIKQNKENQSEIQILYIKIMQKTSKKRFSCQSAKLSGQIKFILNIYNILKAIAKNKLDWQNKLLYNCQDIGLGNGNSKNMQRKHFQNSDSTDKLKIQTQEKKLVKGVYWIQDVFYDANTLIRNKQNQSLIQKVIKKSDNINKQPKHRNQQQSKANHKGELIKTQQNQLQQQYKLIQKQIQQQQRKKQSSKQDIRVQIDPNHSEIQEIINQALNQQKQRNSKQQDMNNDNVVTNRRRSSRKDPPRRRSSRQK